MADPDAVTNGVGASQDQAIDIDDAGDGSSEVDLIVSSTLDQLDRDTDLTAITIEHESPTAQDRMGENMELAAAAVEHESPLFVSQGSPSPSNDEVGEALYPDLIERDGLAVVVPRIENQWEFRRYEESAVVVEILEEYDDGGLVEYLVQLDGESEEVVSRHSGFLSALPHSLTCRFIHESFIPLNLHLT